ncbi:MAG: PHB depolymerase family esterase [Phycisphaerae bacterium]|nr:PHB depolymerase family esterase [Phycisphaerae bacterium]
MSRTYGLLAATGLLLVVGIIVSLSQCQGCAHPAKPPVAPPVATPQPTPSATQPAAKTRPAEPKPAGKLVKLTHDRLKLEYQLYLPKGYRLERQWPLVVAFGAGSDSPLVDSDAAAVEVLADEHGYLVLVPRLSKALPERDDPNRAAVLGGCVTEASALVEAVIARWSVDSRRMVVVGWCTTPELATRLATDRPGRFAGLLLVMFGGAELRKADLDAKKAGQCKDLRVVISGEDADADWFRTAGVKDVSLTRRDPKAASYFVDLPSVVPAK